MNNEISQKELSKTKKPVLKPLPVECFYEKGRIEYQGKILTEGRKCGKIFEIKYNRRLAQHVQRNNWDYWTEQETDKEKYICNSCLGKLHKEDKYTFWQNIRSEKKRRILRAYIASGL